MKQHLIDKYTEIEHLLRCPKCGSDCYVKAGSILCTEGHCYDISANGYVNYLFAKKDDFYDKQLFENRNKVFGMGFFESVLNEIAQYVNVVFYTQKRLALLDAGCGEGYYSREIYKSYDKETSVDLFALDISKLAVKKAASRADNIKWLVADVGNIPLKDHSMDVLINVLTPANYAEFARVLKKDALLLKLIPGVEYLKELKEYAPRKNTYTEERVLKHMEEYAEITDKITIRQTFKINAQQAEAITKMTPLMKNADYSLIPYDKISEITINMELIAARMKER